MALSVADATAFLRSRHVRVLDEWIVECLEWLQEQYQGNNVKPEEMREYVYEQWLDSDLSEIATPALPAGIAQQRKTTLTGCYALQMNSVQDVSVPAYGQLVKLQGKENENALVCAATQSNQPSQNKFEPKSSRMLMLQLSDGHQFIQGIEYQPISQLSVDTVPGTKILVSGSVQCRLGILLLAANNVRVLGGDVESLAETNSKISILSRALGVDESQEAGQEQRQIPSTDRQMTNGDFAPSTVTNRADRRDEMTSHAQSHGLGTDQAAFRDEAEFFSDDLGDELDTLMLNEIEMIEEMDQIQRLAGSAEEETEWPSDEDDSIIEVLVGEVERAHGGGQTSNVPRQDPNDGHNKTTNGAFQEYNIPGDKPHSVHVERTHGVSNPSDISEQNANMGNVERTCAVGNISNILGRDPNREHVETACGVNQALHVPGQNPERGVHGERAHNFSSAQNMPGKNLNRANVNRSCGFNQAEKALGQNASRVYDGKSQCVTLTSNISGQKSSRDSVGKAEGVRKTSDVQKQEPNIEHKTPHGSTSLTSHAVTNFAHVRVKPVSLPLSKTTQPPSLVRDLGGSSRPDSKAQHVSCMKGNGNTSRLNHKEPTDGFKAEPQLDQGMNRGNKTEPANRTQRESLDRGDLFHSQIEKKSNLPLSTKNSSPLSGAQAIPSMGSSTFPGSTTCTRQDAAVQNLKIGSSNPAQAVGVASRFTKDLPSLEGGSQTTGLSTSASPDIPTKNKMVETLSAEESLSAAKRRRLHSGQGGCPSGVDSSSVIQLSSVMSRIWAKEEFTFTIKGFVVTLLSSLNRNNGYWNISAKISDKTATLDVDLSNEVLTGLIGYSVPEMMQMRKMYKKDATTAKDVETKLRQGLAQCQKSFIEMHCTMTVSVKSDQERPLVTSIGKTDPSDIATNFREVPKKY